ncbi:3-oxoacyl-[acyl-carrier-protein] reductase FabG [Corynebacterium afermentans subsp. afermentans]|uniref:Short-chain dehydrogenase n=1 Tax=Corynebacterium afermentans TaxID=38286 RepID=A0A9X8R6W7_9CORY|nr:SDR family oxidoreductase [Corynebacterium afermentans]MCG7274591.1 SDR family oxidoreductase [Corynebacterium afermentans]MCG7292820.1 SDR family oxidoreductase [Corynebacterium afermentans]MDC7109536.1 SDR family oxidoreductase [Corynebacterium afermentans]OAA17313.1 short chain dehydrogenase [Corynebacterium afermentans subsp. afermentans]WJY56207.1 3-oxoacyl-[acyl-carrier-protein] reductase FabG [Corynebacterium afermentans subsp. afermentans]
MKKALITGASRGIGRAIAEDLGKDHHIYAGASKDASDIVSSLPSAEPFEADLTDTDAVLEAASNIEELDVLVLAAGVMDGGPLEELTDDTWREMMEVNLFAPVTLTRALLPALRRSSGLIITINSGAGFHGMAENSAYCASKFALRGFTESLAQEEAGKVRVTSLHPGRTDTDMLAGDNGRPKMAADEVAKAARLAVDAGPDAVVEFLRVRPALTS